MRKLLNYCVLILTVFAGAGNRISNGQQYLQQCTKNPAFGNNELSKCIKRESCYIDSGKQFVTCGRRKVCCPASRIITTESTTTTSPPILDFAAANKVALQKCYEYARYIYTNYTIPHPIIGYPPLNRTRLNCSYTEPLIVGGVKAKLMEFPYMALLGYSNAITSESTWTCGGSLISDRFILSAAHCKSYDRQQVNWAMLGLLSKKKITKQSIGINVFRIVERIIHPEYQPYINDIALYKLEKPLELNPLIRPVCIHEDEKPMPLGTSTFITGWGKINPDEIVSDSLLKGVIKNLDPEKCAIRYKENGFNSTKMICGGQPNNETNTCQGDSGGPMQMPIPKMLCMMRQVGIASLGLQNCANRTPTIYTRVSYYLTWIQAIVWPQRS